MEASQAGPLEAQRILGGSPITQVCSLFPARQQDLDGRMLCSCGPGHTWETLLVV